MLAGAIAWVTHSMMGGMLLAAPEQRQRAAGVAAIVLMPIAASIVQLSSARAVRGGPTGAKTTHDPALADAGEAGVRRGCGRCR
jgi:hypothetical protein